MITRLSVENFKTLEKMDIDLGDTAVFIGPNNSGKTSALQALILWNTGLHYWLEKRGDDERDLKRSGVTINRRDLFALPLPSADLLWRNCHTRTSVSDGGKSKTKNIMINIIVEGMTHNQTWKCGLEFDYGNSESFYCRPLRLDDTGEQRMPLPPRKLLDDVRVAFLPPMSGLSSVEPRLETGRVNVLIGEGQTAQVLRNLCYAVYVNQTDKWQQLDSYMQKLFGVELDPPEYIVNRGEINLSYLEHGRPFDISVSGRGVQQTLLLLAYILANPNTTLVLDEPDAHLEILRQRQIYDLITKLAREQGSQIIAASHSEVILQEAVEKDSVIAFVGRPHKINDKGFQLVKALRDIGFDHYYAAEAKGWVLYLEGSTDFSILKTFAELLDHPVAQVLNSAFVHYISTNIPQQARKHFYGLKEGYSHLTGIAIYDYLENIDPSDGPLSELVWTRREIENYIYTRESLIAYAYGRPRRDTLFEPDEAQRRRDVMEKCIAELEQALRITNRPSPWSHEIKASDDFLDPLFRNYLGELNLPLAGMQKSRYYQLLTFMDKGMIDAEVTQKLDSILTVASKARPWGS